MRKGILIGLASLALSAGVVSAQDAQPATKPNTDKPALAEVPAPSTTDCTSSFQPDNWGCWNEASASGDFGAHVWADMEYLVFWIKDGPVPGPLVTTGNPNQPFAGTLGKGNETVLFGESNLNYGTFAGMQGTIGAWVTPDQLFGIEVGGFLLESRSVSFGASSDGNGNPPLYIPAYNVAAGQEFKLIVADPVQQFAGSVLWTSTTRLWGTDTNGVFGSWSNGDFHGMFLAGFRYVDLQESLQLSNTTATLPNPPGPLTTLNDNFQTHNQFFGPQIGAKLGWRYNFLTIDVIAKLALGDNHESVDINGSLTETGGASPGTFRGGLFAQPTNITNTQRDEFIVVPEIQIKLGCEIVHNVRAFVGYDLVYISQTVRPGEEVDRNLNLSQSPITSSTPALQGAANPAPLFNRSDFFANGVTFGLEIKF